MSESKQVSGARAVYLVAAELSRRGLIASVTARNAKGADILVSDEGCQQSFSVQVKSSRRRGHWLVGKGLLYSKSHIFVFVYLPQNESKPEFYVVPSLKVQRIQKDEDKKMPYVERAAMERYQDKWAGAFKLKTHR